MNSLQNFIFRVFLCACLILPAVLPGSDSAAGEVAVIKVRYRWATELAPIVKSVLTSDGTVTVSKRVNSLVIVDTPEAIQRVHALLDRLDKPVEQVRIHVRFHTAGTDRDRSLKARGRISSDNLSIATGGKRKDGVDISVQDRKHRIESDSEFFVMAMSGSTSVNVTVSSSEASSLLPSLSEATTVAVFSCAGPE